MWQLTFLFGLIPSWIWTTFLVAGIIALTFSWFTKLYKVPLKVGGIISIIVSSWFLGIAANESKWQSKVKELEEKLAKAEEESKINNVQIEEKIIYRDRIIKQKGEDRIEYIDKIIREKEEVIKFVENCPVPKVIIEEHNKMIMDKLNEAAKNPKGETK
jgi:hypothetical protein